MKVRALTEIPTAKGIIPAGQVIEIPPSVMEKLKGKVDPSIVVVARPTPTMRTFPWTGYPGSIVQRDDD